jgi:signal transduction histidine kinase
MAIRLRSLGTYLTILCGLLILVGLYLTSLYSYLLFHALVELFIVVVLGGIFMIAWNARRFLENAYILFIGIAYLFVAFLELLHTLAYKGMGAFPGFDANLPTQLWIAARYVESISLLVAPLFLGKKIRAGVVFGILVAVVALLLSSIFLWEIFPSAYVEGVGLTAFKRGSEYIICLVLLASALVLFLRSRFFDAIVLRLLIASILLNVASELAFTFYVGVYDSFNLLGHFLKLLAFYLIYRAVIVTSLVAPYDLLFRELKQSEKDLRQRTVELQTRNEELDAFAHTVAHDLKTPLGLVVGYSELICEDYARLSEEEWEEYVGVVARAGRKMNEIIDELLLLSQVRKEEVEVHPLDMARIVHEARTRLAQLVESHQAEIGLPDYWPVAVGYGPWVEEVWANYLSNAIEHGGRPPHIEIGATSQAEGMVRFWVRDNGPGILPEEQGRLFTPFVHLGRSHAVGHGLGLSIVRRIVEKLGGQVGVESDGRPDHGSVFYFTLPAMHEGG